MKFSKASPAERAALVRMVAASANLIVAIGIAIKHGKPDYTDAIGLTVIRDASEHFVGAIIGVQESEEETAKESYL